MSDTPTSSVDVTAELASVGLQQLTLTRDAAMRIIGRELNTPAKSQTELPEWILTEITKAGCVGLPPFWDTLREHLAGRTAYLISIAQFGKGVTGGSLAAFLGIELELFALEGWPLLCPIDLQATGDTENV